MITLDRSQLRIYSSALTLAFYFSVTVYGAVLPVCNQATLTDCTILKNKNYKGDRLVTKCSAVLFKRFAPWGLCWS